MARLHDFNGAGVLGHLDDFKLLRQKLQASVLACPQRDAEMEKADSTCPVHPITALAAATVKQRSRLQARFCHRLKKGITSKEGFQFLSAA